MDPPNLQPISAPAPELLEPVLPSKSEDVPPIIELLARPQSSRNSHPPPRPRSRASSAAPSHSISENSSPTHHSSAQITNQDPVESRTSYETTYQNTPLEAPWKYAGYRVFSRWLSLDNGLLIVRRFGALNARILLSMQDEIVQLEEKLTHLDDMYSKPFLPGVVNNSSFRKDQIEERRHLIQEVLPNKLKEYNSFLNSYTQLLSRPPPDTEDLKALQKFLSVNQYAIDPSETAYASFVEDLIPLHPKNRSWIRHHLESNILLRIPFLRSLFILDPSPSASASLALIENNTTSTTIFQDDEKLAKWSSIVVSSVGLIMLVVPLWVVALSEGGTGRRLGWVTGFIVVFYGLVLVATRGRAGDSLAATAAYSAILMVFLGAASI